MKKCVGIVGLSFVFACGVFGSDETGDPPPPGEPGPHGEPPVDGKTIDGVFVSSSMGNDTSEGSSALPIKTLKIAMQTAKQRNKPVVACAEEYSESIELLDGVTLYGNYDCKTWTRTEARAKIKGTPYQPVISARGLTLPTLVDGFDVTNAGVAEVPPGTSSVAVSVSDSKGLTFSAVSIHAGDGAPGKDGADPSANVFTGTQSAESATSTHSVNCFIGGVDVCTRTTYVRGGAGGSGTCTVGPAPGPGGQGGDGAFLRNSVPRVEVERRGRPLTATEASNRGGEGLPTLNSRGADGARGGHGENGKNGTWTFAGQAFVPGDGTAGANGLPGQGGGGGGGSRSRICPGGGPGGGECSYGANGDWETARGGGGGAGGCAGLAGAAGTGGGASIALFVVASRVTLIDVKAEGGKGGRAGRGSLGTVGGSGGLGGSVFPVIVESGGTGGKGGAGGHGGFAGHGAPGPSIALVWSGTRPETDAKTELLPGTPGDGQPASTRDDQTPLPAVVGEGKAEHSF